MATLPESSRPVKSGMFRCRALDIRGFKSIREGRLGKIIEVIEELDAVRQTSWHRQGQDVAL